MVFRLRGPGRKVDSWGSIRCRVLNHRHGSLRAVIQVLHKVTSHSSLCPLGTGTLGVLVRMFLGYVYAEGAGVREVTTTYQTGLGIHRPRKCNEAGRDPKRTVMLCKHRILLRMLEAIF